MHRITKIINDNKTKWKQNHGNILWDVLCVVQYVWFWHQLPWIWDILAANNLFLWQSLQGNNGHFNIGYPSQTHLKLKLAQSYLLIIHETVSQLFWNFVQSMAVSLPCSVQNLKTIEQLKWLLWVNEILRDFSLQGISYTTTARHTTDELVSNGFQWYGCRRIIVMWEMCTLIP